MDLKKEDCMMLPGYNAKVFIHCLITGILVFFLTGCVSLHKKGDLALSDNDASAIHQLVAAQEKAVNQGDMDRFMGTLYSADAEYCVEQKRWFQYFHSAGAKDYVLNIEDMARRSETEYVARISQSYVYKSLKKVTFDLRFVKTGTGWKDADLEYQVLETDHFIIKGTTGIGQVWMNKIAKDAEKAYEKVTSFYGEQVPGKTTIKLFDNQPLLRDRTIISTLWKFAGWYEYPESIKYYIDSKRSEAYAKVIAHELVHKMTLSRATNLPTWFAEGLAVYYGTFNMYGGNYIQKGWMTKVDHVRSIDWMIQQNFETLKGQKNIDRAYSVAGMIVTYIEKVYGEGKSKQLLEALSHMPQRGEEGFEYKKHNELFAGYLNQCIKTELGVDMETFNEEWLSWIKN
jgi:hypothetical protein